MGLHHDHGMVHSRKRTTRRDSDGHLDVGRPARPWRGQVPRFSDGVALDEQGQGRQTKGYIDSDHDEPDGVFLPLQHGQVEQGDGERRLADSQGDQAEKTADVEQLQPVDAVFEGDRVDVLSDAEPGRRHG